MVPTQWNSLVETSVSALYLHNMLNALCLMLAHNKPKDVHLLCYKLREDWTILEQLCPLLEVHINI
jgi:hypothetical protein